MTPEISPHSSRHRRHEARAAVISVSPSPCAVDRRRHLSPRAARASTSAAPMPPRSANTTQDVAAAATRGRAAPAPRPVRRATRRRVRAPDASARPCRPAGILFPRTPRRGSHLDYRDSRSPSGPARQGEFLVQGQRGRVHPSRATKRPETGAYRSADRARRDPRRGIAPSAPSEGIRPARSGGCRNGDRGPIPR